MTGIETCGTYVCTRCTCDGISRIFKENEIVNIETFKEDDRSTLQVACGNNCTLVLRGHFKVPSLFTLCRDKIIKTMDQSQLPPIVASIFEDFQEHA